MSAAREFVEKAGGRVRPLPGALVRLAAVVSAVDFEIGEAASVIAADPALAAETLAMANSAASASVRRIEAIGDAVVRLGAPKILAWAAARRLSPELSAPQPWYGLGQKDLWRHSLLAALAAERLRVTAKARGIEVPGSTYAAALLHDIGKILLAAVAAPDRRHQIREYAAQGVPWAEAERFVLGTTHAAIGEELLRSWNLPEQICAAVGRHHDTERATGPLDDVLHVSNVVAKFSGVGMGAEGMGLRADPESAARLKVSQKDLEAIALESFLELARHDELLSSAVTDGAATPAAAPLSAKPALRVLVVDDSAVMRRMILRALKIGNLGEISSLEASNGREAIELLAKTAVDLALIDINMPGMNGEELLEALRANERWRKLPVIVVSTEGSATRVERLKLLGAGFVRKPFTPESIVAAARREIAGVLS